MHTGLVSYTNRNSGVGVFAWEFIEYLGARSILSVYNRKGQEQWLDRQVTAPAGCPDSYVERYLEEYHPDVVMFVETPFNPRLTEMARRQGVKTIAIAMHESHCHRMAMQADLVICPCPSAYVKAVRAGARAKLLFLPIGLKLFRYRKRTGHTFVQNLGYNEYNDRRQTAKLVKAFRGLEDPGARLILRTQGKWPAGVMIDDPRITYLQGNVEGPGDLYAQGDIAVYPMAYEGYGRMVLESMASGMPCLTVDADPMNLFQHDPDFLVKPWKQQMITAGCALNTIYNEVSGKDLRERLKWLLTIDTAEYSRRARRQAEAQSWEGPIDYKAVWMKTLEDV